MGFSVLFCFVFLSVGISKLDTNQGFSNFFFSLAVAVTPLRQSPRKKAVQQPAAQNPLSLSLLTDAASYIERARGDKSTCEPHSGKAKANPQVPDQPQPAASGSSSEDERPAKHTAGKPPKVSFTFRCTFTHMRACTHAFSLSLTHSYLTC